MPASYKLRDLFAAFGIDLSPTASLEFNALRLDQTDVEFPGLVYDSNSLVTDGYEVTGRAWEDTSGPNGMIKTSYNRHRPND